MADVILFHSALGLRPAVLDLAERLRAAGHTVHVPDLYAETDGPGGAGTAAPVVTDDTQKAAELVESVGREELLRRAARAAAPHSERRPVYAGLSLGASLAQTVALGDSRARGLLLLHGTADLPEDASAPDLPAQLHIADPDPFEPHDWQTAWYLGMRRAGVDLEVFRYPGAGHLYTDPDLPDHDAEATERTLTIALDFLAELDAAGE
ncbi:dienelactone hydrolase family protein [Streptomyces sp. ST2-7A]|uniref:dienelactone hydrolase family protein n=1 Tax=Streptomyces sp. ST2-7A TaxID=2907214 RepID=UPI001F1996FB|nr:dienelactone hydrolase family protein [Streptomyces sp. ST2-7A]